MAERPTTCGDCSLWADPRCPGYGARKRDYPTCPMVVIVDGTRVDAIRVTNVRKDLLGVAKDVLRREVSEDVADVFCMDLADKVAYVVKSREIFRRELVSVIGLCANEQEVDLSEWKATQACTAVEQTFDQLRTRPCDVPGCKDPACAHYCAAHDDAFVELLDARRRIRELENGIAGVSCTTTKQGGVSLINAGCSSVGQQPSSRKVD